MESLALLAKARLFKNSFARITSLSKLSLKGSVCYIFASLFFKSKREHLSN